MNVLQLRRRIEDHQYIRWIKLMF